MRLAKLVAAGTLLACFLGGFVSSTRAASKLHSRPEATGTYPVFVTNPGSGTMSAYPVGSFGNVASLITSPNLQSPSGIARDSSGNMYAVNPTANTITVYAAEASGDPNPSITISGSNTGLNNPVAIALDANGNIYVANAGSAVGSADSVTIFPAGSNGNATPSAVITGTETGLSLPAGLALDTSKNIYVSNQVNRLGLGTITVYAAGSNGNVAPINTVSGSNTGLWTPVGITLDSSRNIYVANDDIGGGAFAGAVEEFSVGSTGNASPVLIIPGSCSGLDDPQAIAVDSADNIYVANSGQATSNPSITVYAQESSGSSFNGCTVPTATISGATTSLVQPAGLTLDSTLNIYVTDSYAGLIAVFSAGSNGNVAPTEAIADPNTGMNYPLGVALDESGNIYVADAGSQNGGYDNVFVYPAGTNANVAPTATISGGGTTNDKTLLNYPDAITIGPDGGIYVANALGGPNGNGSVLTFSKGSNGNVAPERDVSGANTGMNYPVGIALGTANSLHVLNQFGGPDQAGSITIFPNSDNGDVVPSAVIKGTSTSDQTGFNNPSGIALDSSNKMYVTNDGSLDGGVDSVTIYAANANGNVAPTATISGSSTQLELPSGIAVDGSGNIYVANDGSLNGDVDTITVYPAGSNGNVAPSIVLNGNNISDAVISGLLTGLSGPAGITLAPSFAD